MKHAYLVTSLAAAVSALTSALPAHATPPATWTKVTYPSQPGTWTPPQVPGGTAVIAAAQYPGSTDKVSVGVLGGSTTGWTGYENHRMQLLGCAASGGCNYGWRAGSEYYAGIEFTTPFNGIAAQQAVGWQWTNSSGHSTFVLGEVDSYNQTTLSTTNALYSPTFGQFGQGIILNGG
jgi:hypothetical protein